MTRKEKKLEKHKYLRPWFFNNKVGFEKFLVNRIKKSSM